MHYTSLTALTQAAPAIFDKGAIGLVLAEDDVLLMQTLHHLAQIGLKNVVVFCRPDLSWTAPGSDRISRVDYDLSVADPVPNIVNAMIKACPDRWIYWGYNAEFLYYPFCESRSIDEMLTFVTEERRDVVMTSLIDLYAQDLNVHPSAVDQNSACFDSSGYYAQPITDAQGHPLDRQISLHGGLRWRFEEHIPKDRQRIDRAGLFRARAGLIMGADRRFNMPEHNTYACPWHNSLTGAVASFRTAKALRRNPGSRSVITTFHWPQSVRFDWTSAQLMDLGMMEPGQWF